MKLPRLLITLGDVAGIGPEIVARAWPQLVQLSHPVVIGDPDWLARGVQLVGSGANVQSVSVPADARPGENVIPCIQATQAELKRVEIGRVSAEAGRAAYDFLCRAIDLTMQGAADGIVTCPLHKEGLRGAASNIRDTRKSSRNARAPKSSRWSFGAMASRLLT